MRINLVKCKIGATPLCMLSLKDQLYGRFVADGGEYGNWILLAVMWGKQSSSCLPYFVYETTGGESAGASLTFFQSLKKGTNRCAPNM